jgi:hypothetical protein
MMIGVVLLLVLTCVAQNISGNQTVTVTTQDGDVLGYQTESARVFYGIPFAQPPINDLR